MNNNKVKINKLNVYYKNQNRLDKWLVQVEIYFIFNMVLPKCKPLFMSIFFIEWAKKWFKPILKKFLNNNNNSERKFP